MAMRTAHTHGTGGVSRRRLAICIRFCTAVCAVRCRRSSTHSSTSPILDQLCEHRTTAEYASFCLDCFLLCAALHSLLHSLLHCFTASLTAVVVVVRCLQVRHWSGRHTTLKPHNPCICKPHRAQLSPTFWMTIAHSGMISVMAISSSNSFPFLSFASASASASLWLWLWLW